MPTYLGPQRMSIILLQMHYAATWALVGLIWVVQLVIYPQFADIAGGSTFKIYHQRYTMRITWVVLPLMVTELLTATAICMLPLLGDQCSGVIALDPLGTIPPGRAWAGLSLVGAAWLLTGLVAVPLHTTLEQGFDEQAHQALLRVNWFRTVIWSLRGLLVSSWMCDREWKFSTMRESIARGSCRQGLLVQ